jgi:hypothetical protein
VVAWGIFALKIFDFANSEVEFFSCLAETPAGNFLVMMGFRRLKRMIAAITMTSRTKKTAIKLGINHRRLDFEFFACFASMVLGMLKNESERDDCTSILFKAFRMELNVIILYPNSIIVCVGSWAGEPLGDISKPGIAFEPGIMILYSAGAYQKSLWICSLQLLLSLVLAWQGHQIQDFADA